MRITCCELGSFLCHGTRLEELTLQILSTLRAIGAANSDGAASIVQQADRVPAGREDFTGLDGFQPKAFPEPRTDSDRPSAATCPPAFVCKNCKSLLTCDRKLSAGAFSTTCVTGRDNDPGPRMESTSEPVVLAPAGRQALGNGTGQTVFSCR